MKYVVVTVILGLAIAGFVFVSTGGEDTPDAALQSFSAEDVAQHDAESDCWMIIEGKVYDVTDYIQLHPGGDEILLGCGRDATVLFTTRTTETGETIGSGESHSSDADSTLRRYLIGEVN